MLYDALLSLGYNGDALIYHCWLSMAHGMEVCEASVTIPIDPSEPWLGSVITNEPNTAIQMILSESCLTATVALHVALLPIWYQENPMWQ
jgi:hypothetical protein